MKRKIYSLLVACTMLFASSCDLDLLDSPNEVTLATANPNWILNSIQSQYANVYHNFQFRGERVTRIVSQPNVNYFNAYGAPTFNGAWNTSYAGILNNIKALEELNEASPIPRHLAMANVFRAMILMHLVDFFDDVPWSQALDPSNFNPEVDKGQQVYAAAFQFLEDAEALFAEETANLPTDLYYANNVTQWRKLINTLKLKYHLNLRLTNPSGSTQAISALISGGELMGVGDEFVWRYGVTLTNPGARHPRAGQLGGGGGDYQGTWYMFHLTEFKGFDDPRVRYYLYRQTLSNPTDPDELRCLGEIAPGHYLAGGFPFCLPNMTADGRGYWGRDHLNNEGIPPDGLLRTLWGLYPAGNRFDDNAGSPSNNLNAGAQGAGIAPIMLPAFVDFMLAEAALTLGTEGDPKALMLSGIEKHMNYVRSWSLTTLEGSRIQGFQDNATWNELVDEYLTYVDEEWDGVPASRQLNLVAREYWLSLYGSGIEAYNLYRRTGQPDGMQPSLIPDPGPFPRSFLYPNIADVTNRNIVQRPGLGHRVFWDNNPEGNDWTN